MKKSPQQPAGTDSDRSLHRRRRGVRTDRRCLGDYYFALRQGASLDSIAYLLGRPWREVVTRYHARRPWWIPVKLVGELGALVWAFRLAPRGPRYLQETLATP